MDVKATIVVRKLEVNLEGKQYATAEVAFKIGNMPIGIHNTTRVTIPATEELIKYCENVVTAQVGERIQEETQF